MRRLALGTVMFALAAAPAAEARVPDHAASVNPFVGTQASAPDFGTGGGAGNTFPGATMPFGMLQWSPDTVPGSDNFSGGYSYGDSRMRGFSLLHLGGGCASMQDVPFLPTTTPVTKSPALQSSGDLAEEFVPQFTHGKEQAAPGDYRVRLDPGSAKEVEVELTATPRTGHGRFTFPSTRNASFLINAGGSAMANTDASVRIDPGRREVSGSVSSGQFCFQRNRYKVYFAAEFSRPFARQGTWRRQTLSEGSTSSSDTANVPANYKPIPGGPKSLPGNPSGSAQSGAYVTFDTTSDRKVEAKVAVSFVSEDGARRNLQSDESRGFEDVRGTARARWNRTLDRIRIRGGSKENRWTFYSMLYRALLHPNLFSDVDGRYMGMDGQVHDAKGFDKYANYSGWDVYRSQMPLVAMLFPEGASDMVRSLLADARESGCLPKWQIAGGHTNVMIGDPADSIIASAHALGARGFDAGDALRAMVKGATQECRSQNGGYIQREAIDQYQSLGYVPSENDWGLVGHNLNPDLVWGAASTTLEYAVADFAIARLAAAIGDRAAYARFARRSANWRNLFNTRTRYIEPRSSAGTFTPNYDPASGDGFAEGSAAQYTWMVPHDPAGLIQSLGGRDAAIRRLDEHFERLNDGPHSLRAFLGNEPEAGVPWLYDWLGRPDRTQRVVRDALDKLFGSSPSGYPGNDDLGQLSAWYVLGALGLHPAVPGTDLLALGSPLFTRARVTLPGDGHLTISGERAGPDRPYVRSLKLSGRPHTRPWTCFAALADGGELAYSLDSRPHQGLSGDPPPSFGANAPLESSPGGCVASPLGKVRIRGVRARGGRRRESITLFNRGSRTVRLRGATLRGGRRRFRFPRSLRLRPRRSLRIVGRCARGRRRPRRLGRRLFACWGANWRDRGGVAKLADRTGHVVSQRGYGRRRGAVRW